MVDTHVEAERGYDMGLIEIHTTGGAGEETDAGAEGG
jgi:hypothetical protein